MSRIMIVDDHNQDRYMLKVLLEGNGHQIVEAEDGEEALKKARRDPPDLIVTDILMPGKDGFTLCREWKRDEGLNHIPLVYYTGTYTDARDEQLAMSLGADKFLVKPADPDLLVSSVEEVLSAANKGKPATLPDDDQDEDTFLKRYSEVLVRKLEDKLVQQDGANRALTQEIEEHKRTEAKLRKANRALQVLSDINQTLVRSKDENRLLEKVCKILVEVGGYHLAWVGIALHDNTNGIRLAAHAGENEEFLSRSQLSWAETGPDSEPAVRAINTGKIVIIPEIARSSVHRKWRDRCLQLGFGSTIALPMKVGQGVTGVLNIFSSAVDCFDSVEVALLKELADDMAYGIQTLHVASERDKAKADLDAAHEHLAATMNALPDLLFEVDKDGRIHDYRAKDRELLFVAPEIFLGKTMGEVLPAEAGRVVMSAIKKAVRKGSHTGDQYLLELPGGIKWFELSIAAKGDPEKPCGRLILLARDITVRKLAEEALRSSEAKYQNLYDRAPVAYFSVGSAGEILEVNKAAVKLTGYPMKELLRMKVFELYHEQSLRKAGDVFHSITSGHGVSNVGMVYRKKNGQIVHGLLSVSPDVGKDGRLVQRKSIVVDITARREAEKALLASEARYRGLVENVAVSICEGDCSDLKQYAESLQARGPCDFKEYFGQHPDDLGQCVKMIKLLDVNQFTLRMFGAKSVKELRNNIGRIIKGAHEVVANAVIRIAQNQMPFRTEVTLNTIHGDKVHVSLNVAVPPGHEHAYSLVLATMTDITDRRRLEEQLLHSQKMEAVGRLAGGVAHDFNNLLTVILGYCHMLVPVFEEGDPVRTDIQEINEAAERAVRLTRRLLAFSRRQVLHVRVLDLNQLLGGMEKMLRRLLREDVELRIIRDANLGTITADPSQIEQVIMNLAVNASDAMPGGGQLLITTQNTSYTESFLCAGAEVKAGDYILLTVADTGKGIPEKIQDKIFDPFFTTKELGHGTGLGLATVYGTVKQSGGHIWVSSEPGQGTSFTVCLTRSTEVAKPVRKTRTPDITGGDETILIVEDDETVRTLTHKMLAKYGYTVLEAEDGKSAMRTCKQYREPIHLVLTDVVMPKMSGPELIERVTELHTDVKVLYMSGYTDKMIDSAAIGKPGTGYIQKPFAPVVLALKVREVLEA